MTPDYRAMAAGLRDLGVAATRTEAQLLSSWLRLVAHCGQGLADDLSARAVARRQQGGSLGPGCVAAAASTAARDYVRGVAALPGIALLEFAVELDRERARERPDAGGGAF